MIEDHPFIAMLQRHFLNVGKHADRHDNLTAIGKQHAELATHIEVEAKNTNNSQIRHIFMSKNIIGRENNVD